MLKARATTRLITPDRLPIRLGGYAAASTAVDIDSDLEVNCIALTDGRETAIILSLDLLYVSHRMREAVLARVSDLGIKSADLFLAASHTHYAPAIDETKPALGAPEVGYRDQIVSTIVEAVRDAVQGPMESVQVASAARATPIGINRRKRRVIRLVRGRIEFNKVAMCPNPQGPADPHVSVVALRARDRVLAYIWSAACHPTGLAPGDRVSAHWPGTVRDALRRAEHSGQDSDPEVPVLFLQGFSGDVRPPSGRAKAGFLVTQVRWMRLGPVFDPLDPDEYRLWADLVAQQVTRVARGCDPRASEPSLSSARMELPAWRFASGAEGLPPVSFHQIRIGDISIVGASAELVSGYAPRVRAMAPDSLVIPVGCIDHVIGYWPLEHMFREGGYEVVHHCPSFGITACSPDIEKTVLEQFRLLLGKGGPGS